jgi:hypothetical protein
MAAMRRIVLLATLLGSVLSGYVFFAGSAATHAFSGSSPQLPCSGGPFPC